MKRVVMIHTVAPLIETFARLSSEALPGAKVFHVLDEPMLEQARARGAEAFASGAHGLRRLEEHFIAAAQIGAQAALVTCSTISPYVPDRYGELPVLRIDDAMIARAVERGEPVTALATNPATLEPTRAALEKRARESGRQITVRAVLVEDAFQAYRNGDFALHDRLVREAVLREQGKQKTAVCLMLAQASMARALDTLPPGALAATVLTSPRAALDALQELLGLPGG